MEREISLKELFDVIWKGKWIIAIAAVGAFVLAAAGAFIMDSRQSQVATIITLQWDGINDGEYPDGTSFDYATMVPAHVLTLSLAESGIDSVSADDVRNNLTVTPIVPDDVLSMIQAALERGETMTYYATDYKWTLDNGNLGISVTDASGLLDEIRVQLKADFARKYVNQISVLDFTDVDFTEYDYLDAYEILNAQINAIESVIEPRSEVEFVSSSGYSFSDILVRTDLLQRIELNQIITRTNNYLLTRDDVYLISSYQYKKEQAELDLAKATAKEVEIQDLVTNYKEINNIVIPGLEDTDIAVDTYYSELMAGLVELQNEIAELTHDIDYYQTQMDRLNGVDPTFTVTPQQQAEEVVKVERNIDDAVDKLDVIINDTEVLLSDFNEFLINSDTIEQLLAPAYQSSVSVLMISAIGLVLGASVGAVVVLLKNDWN